RLLSEIEKSLLSSDYKHDILQSIWATFIGIAHENANDVAKEILMKLYEFVTSFLSEYPLIQPSTQLLNLLEKSFLPTVETSIGIFNEFLTQTSIKPLFYRLLLHPGITEEQIRDFMLPISKLAEQIPKIELVVFFDEVNTSSCLGLFKEMFMDGTL
ncbi:unnamed protein product, partial [Rotaria magnacalcarata]